jgi:hypothetical protein
MTTRPSTLPEWCTVPAEPTDKDAPDAAKKASGFKKVAGTPEKPPYQDHNWFMNLVYLWAAHLSERIFTSENFTVANNQVAAANITGALFAPDTYKSVKMTFAYAGTDGSGAFASYIEFFAVWDGAAWIYNQTEPAGSGLSGLTFSITAGGQIQYTSTNRVGFVSAKGSWHVLGVLQA